jgi:hypothetical protein
MGSTSAVSHSGVFLEKNVAFSARAYKLFQ